MSLYFNNKKKSQFSTKKPIPNIPISKSKKNIKPEIKIKETKQKNSVKKVNNFKPEIKIEETKQETKQEIKPEIKTKNIPEEKKKNIISFKDAGIEYIKFTTKMKKMGIENCNALVKENPEELYNKLPNKFIKKKTFNKYIKKANKVINN